MENDIKTLLNAIYKNYTLIKDIHNTAYSLNEEYRKFWDNHSEENKEKILEEQEKIYVSNKIRKWLTNYYKVIFIFTPPGFIIYIIIKLFQRGKPSKEEQLRLKVTSKDFTNTIKLLNEVLAR